MKRREPVQKVLEDIRKANPNFHILDLFPLLCPEAVCKYYDSEKVFLYRDVYSHLSIEANYRAKPLFLAVVDQAMNASPTSGLSMKDSRSNAP